MITKNVFLYKRNQNMRRNQYTKTNVLYQLILYISDICVLQIKKNPLCHDFIHARALILVILVIKVLYLVSLSMVR